MLGAAPQDSQAHSEHARAAESERRDRRACRSGRSASSARPEKPHHDEQPHRNQEARHRASDAVNQIAGRCAEYRTEYEGPLHAVHDHPREQAAFQRGVRVTSCGLAMRGGVVQRYPITQVGLWSHLFQCLRYLKKLHVYTWRGEATRIQFTSVMRGFGARASDPQHPAGRATSVLT